MKSVQLKFIGSFTALLLNSSVQAQVDANPWLNLDDTLQRRMLEWKIPGLAIAIVEGDSTLFENVYGYADVSTQSKVTKNTLFAIGSCTKFFTTTGLSILADENKLDFNSPVLDYFPDFNLSDSGLQKELLVKDILCHRTGLESGDHLWYGAEYTRQEVLDRLVHLKTRASVRDAFIYNNSMYTLAGAILERQGNMSYESFIEQRLLQPLHMSNTTFDLTHMKTAHALPYGYFDNSYQQLAMPRLKGLEPAGALWSDIEDMSKWLKFHLSSGEVDGNQVVSPQSLTTLKKPIVFTGQGMRADETAFKSYGLGVGFTAYKGHRVMYHTGVAGGYTAIFAFLPEENMGFVILTNTDTYLFAMVNTVFDRFLGLEQTDWNSPVLAAYTYQKTEEEREMHEQAEKIKNSKAVKAADNYVGIYDHAYNKDLSIVKQSNKLVLRYNDFEFPLGQVSDSEFVAYDPIVFGEIKVLFDLDTNGKVKGLNAHLMGEVMQYRKK